MLANFLASLEVMLLGMVGIFFIIALIYVTVLVLSVVSAKSGKKDSDAQSE